MRALALRAENGAVVMLLRVNFIASQESAAWMRADTPSLYISPRRPSFTGKGLDATEDVWFRGMTGRQPW